MPEKLLIIDAHAHIYQSFYAIKGLTGPDGEPVNAVYGFARMIEDLRREHMPDYIAVAFDTRAPLKRKDLYPEYKANRKPMPDALQRQLPLVRELLEAQHVPCVSAPGYEADDVLATMARQAHERGIETIIVTTDKDAEQLIADGITVLHLHADRQIRLDPEALKELKGIEPWQVVEVMSLAGDSTDNVPGVPGVGPKTALKLIRQFGTVERLYDNLDQVTSDKMRERLAAHREDAEIARRLVELECDAPLDVDLDQCRIRADEQGNLRQFYNALGFRSLLPDGEQAHPGGPVQPSLFEGAQASAEASMTTVQKDYRTVTNLDDLTGLIETLRRQETISVDLETTSLQPRDARIVGIAFSWEPDQGVYVATAGPGGDEFCPVDEAVRMLKPLLESERPGKLGQNLKYDISVLKNYGVELRGLRCDSMLASYLLRPSVRGHGLDVLAMRHLNYRTTKIAELIGSGRDQVTMDRVPVARVGSYACEDTDVALQLCNILTEQLHGQDLWELFERMELPLVPVLADMEWTGVCVDTTQLAAISTEFAQKLSELATCIYREAGHEFNINSPKQLSNVLFDEMGLPAPRGGRRTTGYSTASGVLAGLKKEHAIADLVLRHRELDKLKSTYADALLEMVHPRTRRVHASFNQTVTATGRLSSSNPNLQNIPVRTPLGRRIRRAFVAGADDMSLLSADYSQVELRLLAHCSGDPALKRAFEQDSDIHRFVAAQVHGVPEDDVTAEMRQRAKAVNFGIIYGQSAYGLSRQIGVPVPEAERFIADYFERYPQVRAFMASTIDAARRNGWVKTLAGRKRRIEGLNGRGAPRAAAERIAVNSVVQGSAADLIKLAMIEIHNGLPQVSPRARMLIQIHDELVFEAPDDEMERVQEFVRGKMIAALDLDVRLKVDMSVAKNWADAK